MPMTRRRGLSLTGLALLAVVGGCSTDSSVMPTSLAAPGSASRNQSEGRGVFQRYFAIGTSVSMGWRSDGVVAASQATSWPAQLAAMANRTLAQPYIGGFGCPAPLAAPLASFRRISGEPLLVPPGTSLACAPLAAGVTLPVDNVAISGATTLDALMKTPETSGEPASGGLYHRVLQPLHTQVSTMLEANPKIVSVELGGAEVLGALSGIVAPGASIVPYAVWQPAYDQVLDKVGSITKMAVLVGLSDARDIPAMRTGNDLWLDRLEFAAANIAVSTDCNGSLNWIFLSFKLPPVLAAAAHGPVTLSCAESASNVADFILTPTEMGLLNAQIGMMTGHIQSEADKRGYAFFTLGAISTPKAPFSLTTLLTSPTPFGPLFSLDGLHPSAAGSALLARAAAKAINDKYNLGIPVQ